MKKNLSHFAVHFASKNPEALARWYKQNLGFEITFRWGDPVEYVVSNREEVVSIHFVKAENENIQPGSIYVFCYNADQVYEELKNKSIPGLEEIADRDYYMRDFDVCDPEGNRITFGTSLEMLTPNDG
ncbi:MAG: hypothetical protein MI700_12645 [Balneolales bacterium]|nr:hypothetical protein [Balneolales bacterium]